MHIGGSYFRSADPGVSNDVLPDIEQQNHSEGLIYLLRQHDKLAHVDAHQNRNGCVRGLADCPMDYFLKTQVVCPAGDLYHANDSHDADGLQKQFDLLPDDCDAYGE